MNIAEQVYYTLLGQTVDEYKLPWVENAFELGSCCECSDACAREAYDRLRTRLGAADEDPDVESLINAMLSIQKALCLNMFAYGVLYEQNQPRP